MIIQKIAAQTGAVTTTHDFTPQHIGCCLVVNGNLAANTITLNYLNEAGGSASAIMQSGTAVTLSATRSEWPILYAQSIQIVKGVTTNAVGIDIHGLR